MAYEAASMNLELGNKEKPQKERMLQVINLLGTLLTHTNVRVPVLPLIDAVGWREKFSADTLFFQYIQNLNLGGHQEY
jgi:hypothetical protein